MATGGAQTVQAGSDSFAIELAVMDRVHNTFSDSPEGTAYGATANAVPKPESGFGVSSLNWTGQGGVGGGLAARALADVPQFQAPEVSHSGNDWEARNNLRNLAVGANSITTRAAAC